MQASWNIIGHTEKLSQLENEVATGNVGHAYLFNGPRQTGKFRIARIFAKLLQCKKGLCRLCKTCKAIPTGAHPDTILLKDDGQSLGIDRIRELIGQANLSAQSPYRIFLIENIERMPMEAQNSFLKTLEEPPGRTIFILTTCRINDVLPTIRSRVRHYDFFNVDDATLKDNLKQQFPDKSNLDEVINMAQGRPGLAISLMQNEDELQKQRELYGTIERFLKKDDLSGKFLFVEKLLEADKTGEALEVFFDAFTRYLRKLLFEYTEGKTHPLKPRLDSQNLVSLFESLEKTRYLVLRNANRKLALENLLIQTETAHA